MLRTLRTLWRLIGIARILARHDALAPLDELGVAPGVMLFARRLAPKGVAGRPGQKLARALAELGPTFIKLGQFLSTRADLLGEQLAADLSELQDSLPPFSSDQARATVAAELGRAPEEVFSIFNDEPVSAASIAQVHLAVVRDDDGATPEAEDWSGQPLENWSGREVAVKILRPGVERAFAQDLELFYTLAELALRTQPKLGRFKPLEVVRLFEETVRIEMDLRMEAAAASELGDNFADDPTYRVPPVNWQLSSRRILTVGKADGIRMDNRAALLEAGHDLEAVLGKAAAIFFKQVFRDGFFHGDQHPGNMWVDRDGNIVAVDFGIMGRLDRKTRWYLADMLLATLDRDYQRLAEVHVEAGYLPPGASLEVFAQALRSVCEPISGPAAQRDLLCPAAGPIAADHRILRHAGPAPAAAAAEEHADGRGDQPQARTLAQHLGPGTAADRRVDACQPGPGSACTRGRARGLPAPWSACPRPLPTLSGLRRSLRPARRRRAVAGVTIPFTRQRRHGPGRSPGWLWRWRSWPWYWPSRSKNHAILAWSRRCA